MQYSVIIPHFNDVARLTRCLDALMPQVTGRDDVSVIVADNGSSQSLDDLRAKHPDARFVSEQRPGAALARNRGVEETDAEGILFLDADCVPADDWLQSAVNACRANTVTGGRIDTFDETDGAKSGAEAFETVFAFDQEDYIARKGFSVTANMVTTRDVFERAGPFVAGVSEDLDWCRRATATGASLRYDDGLRVRHPTRSDWPALRKKWRRLTDELHGIEVQAGRGRLGWAARALAMPLSAVAHTPRVLSSDALTGGEKMSALATLFRLRMVRMIWMLSQAFGSGAR